MPTKLPYVWGVGTCAILGTEVCYDDSTVAQHRDCSWGVCHGVECVKACVMCVKACNAESLRVIWVTSGSRSHERSLQRSNEALLKAVACFLSLIGCPVWKPHTVPAVAQGQRSTVTHA